MTLGEDPPATNPEATVVAVGRVQQLDGSWKKLCSNCGEWIGLGPKGSEYPFVTHQRSKRCQRMTDWRARQEAKAARGSLMSIGK